MSQQQQSQTSPLSMVAMGLGIGGLCFMVLGCCLYFFQFPGLILSLTAAIMGYVELQRIQKQEIDESNKPLAMTGAITGGSGCAIGVIYWGGICAVIVLYFAFVCCLGFVGVLAG